MVTPATLYRRLPSMSQRARRLAAIAAFTGFPLQALGYAVLVAPGWLPVPLWASISIALFSATLIGVVAIYGYGQGRIDRRERLDERQRTMVDRALIVGYSALTTIIVLVVGIVAVYLSFVGPLTVDMTAFTPWVVAIGLYVPFLPFAALAWIEPDVAADDEA
jgi:hypothetical protein